jgi:hypothetical protein
MSNDKDVLTNVGKFRTACLQYAFAPYAFSSALEHDIETGKLMNDLEVLPVPEELTDKGEFSDLLQHFLRTPPGDKEAEILQGHIIISPDGNEIWFQFNAIMDYLSSKKKSWNKFLVGKWLRELGSENRLSRIIPNSPSPVRYWSIPNTIETLRPGDPPRLPESPI